MRPIIVLFVISKLYLTKDYSNWERHSAEWAAVSKRPNFGLPVFVEQCETPTLLAAFKRCDLYGLSEEDARARLAEYLTPARRPPTAPFPGARRLAPTEQSQTIPFPGAKSSNWTNRIRKSAPLAAWWGFVAVALLAIGLVWFLISWFGGEQKPGKPLMSEWGITEPGFYGRLGHPEDVPPGQTSHIKLDGGRLMYLSPKKYRLMGVLYHLPPNVDRGDVSGISKSNEYDIRDEQVYIAIPWNKNFIDEFAKGEVRSSYALLAVPSSVTKEQFDTLRQAEALGALILEENGGPP
jgi:hypothetical protein